MTDMHTNRAFAILLVFLIVVLAVSSSIDFAKATTYTYDIQGPFYLNGVGDSVDCVICSLVWSNYTTQQLTFPTGGVTNVNIASSNPLYQMTWNSSSALNYTSLIEFKPATYTAVNVYIPNPSLPFAEYTFSVTDFFGMTNGYLEMSVGNASTLASDMAEQFSLNSTGTPTFVMTQYYTYTLTFICDQGTYSQLFTAANILSNSLIVLSGMFPTSNATAPTAEVTRLNSTLIGITYDDPTNTTASGSVLITHKSGLLTITDYTTSSFSNTTTILWNVASPGVSYNVNVTAVIGGISYIWVLVAPESVSTNPFLGKFDFLGQQIDTMPHVQTGWPEGMTSAQIAEIIGASIVMLFLCIGSFRSAGACCMLSWIIFGILIYLGWIGVTSVYMIPQFAFSGFIGILIMIDEAKQQAREI